MQTLIAAGANVNFRAPDGWTALTEVAFRGHTNLAKTLVEAGAAISATHPKRGSALCMAVRAGYEDLVVSLLEKLADQGHARTLHLGEALHTAVYFNQVIMMVILIKAGADVNFKFRTRWATPRQPARSVLYEAVKQR